MLLLAMKFTASRTYWGYHQINMVTNTTFYVKRDIYHYSVLFFGLINTRVTYLRMVNKLFANMTRDTIKAYFDEMLMKFNLSIKHQRDMERSFT